MITRWVGPGRPASWFALALLLLGTTAAYRGALSGGFVYDDVVTVTGNPAVRSFARIAEWIASPYAVVGYRSGANFRPVTVASYAADHAMWGERAAGFHATNVAVHLLVVALVYVLAARLWRTGVSALAAATWMAVHPMNAQAVNYISARSSTLAAAGVLVAVLCYDRWAEARTGRGGTGSARGWLAGALGAGACALGAKESAAVLPVLVICWDRARFGDASPWHESVKRSSPFWGLLGIWLALRAAVLADGASEPMASATSILQGGAFAAKIVLTAAMHSLWPVGLAADYAWPTVLSGGAALAAVAGVALLAGGFWGLTRGDRPATWCGGWFLAALLPTLALPMITRVALYQEHRVYLAEIGAAWLVGGVARRVMRWVGTHAVRRAVTATVVAAMVALAVWSDGERTWVWGDRIRLWDDVLARYPDSAMAHAGRGTWLVNEGRWEEAEREFLFVLRSAPMHSYAHMMLGRIYATRGESLRAVTAYRTALEYRSRYAEARIRLGATYEDLGLIDQALEEYERAIEDDPWATPAVLLTASILDARGRTDEAIERLRRVAPDDPVYDDAQIRLGALLLKQERWVDARAVLAAVAARRPDSEEARAFLEIANAREADGSSHQVVR
ncbi:MAG: tetratricopeptide repeat protein [Nitrospirota bacterium]